MDAPHAPAVEPLVARVTLHLALACPGHTTQAVRDEILGRGRSHLERYDRGNRRLGRVGRTTGIAVSQLRVSERKSSQLVVLLRDEELSRLHALIEVHRRVSLGEEKESVIIVKKHHGREETTYHTCETSLRIWSALPVRRRPSIDTVFVLDRLRDMLRLHVHVHTRAGAGLLPRGMRRHLLLVLGMQFREVFIGPSERASFGVGKMSLDLVLETLGESQEWLSLARGFVDVWDVTTDRDAAERDAAYVRTMTTRGRHADVRR